jgi:predicted enzyme involved in methoxymalonyl-ACP biosynthesis
MQDIVENSAKKVSLYKVKDCFGAYGIVAVIIVDLEAEVPEVEEFAMSCRIMSKNIEYALVEHVEKDLKAAGYKALRGRYIPTAKNKPVEKLYEKLEYTLLEQNEAGEKLYEILLDGCPEREYYAKVL